eukprot:2374791-Pleurochrysis_carterae.AAC.3
MEEDVHKLGTTNSLPVRSAESAAMACALLVQLASTFRLQSMRSVHICLDSYNSSIHPRRANTVIQLLGRHAQLTPAW